MVSTLVCTKKRNGPTSAVQSFLQPAKTAGMCHHLEGDTCPPFPYPAFLASTKSIFKTDCGQGFSEATRHHLQQLESKHIQRKGKRLPGTSVCSAYESLSLSLGSLPTILTKLENQKNVHMGV